MAVSDYEYVVEIYATQQFTEEPNTANISSDFYRISKSTVINVDQKIIYRITIFKKSAPTVPIENDVRLLSTGIFASWKDSVKDLVSVSGIRRISNKYFDITVTAKKSGYLTTPLINPQIELNGVWQNVVRRSTNTIPSLSFTKATKPPEEIPTTVTAPDFRVNGYTNIESENGPYVWHSCGKYWIRYWREGIKRVPGGPDFRKNPSYLEYTVQLKYYNKAGDPVSPVIRSFGKEQTKFRGAFIKDSPSQKAKEVLNQAKNCAKVTPGDGGGGVTPPGPDRSESVPKGTSLYNPYPHVVTRNYKEIAAWPSDQYDSGVKNLDQLGVMYTDPQLSNYVRVEGSTTEYQVDTKRSAIKNRWGFRFLYNPTTWNYSFGADSSGIDWGRGNPNNTILVAGTGTISLQLLIDRVADMNTIRHWDGNKRQGDTPGLPYYPKQLTVEQCAGILYRGTEYDLEYLFRVLNNNLSQNPMFGTAGRPTSATKGLETLSANLGYVTSLPFMLKFNDQLRYKVVLTGLSVNHDIFTKEMIPTRTVVNLQLERIPDFFYDGSDKDKAKRLSFDKETLLQGVYDSSVASRGYVGSSTVDTPKPLRRGGGMEPV